MKITRKQLRQLIESTLEEARNSDWRQAVQQIGTAVADAAANALMGELADQAGHQAGVLTPEQLASFYNQVALLARQIAKQKLVPKTHMD